MNLTAEARIRAESWACPLVRFRLVTAKLPAYIQYETNLAREVFRERGERVRRPLQLREQP